MVGPEPEYGLPAGLVDRLYRDIRRRLLTRLSGILPAGVTEPREVRDLTPNLPSAAAAALENRIVECCLRSDERPHWTWVLRRPSTTAIGYYDLWVGTMLVPSKELS